MLYFDVQKKVGESKNMYHKACYKMATSTDAKSKNTDAVFMCTGKVTNGTDKRSMGVDKVSMHTDKRSMGIAKLSSSKEIPNNDFKLTCKKCNTTRKVDSINGKVKIKKSRSKYVSVKKGNRSYSYHCSGCKGEMTAKSIKKL
jgi:hypothetical protein